MPIEPKLKLKYRTASSGGKYKSSGSNSGSGKDTPSQGTGHRRRSYGPFDTFTLKESSKTKKG